MEFSRQQYWSGLPFPSPGDLPDPGIGPESPASPALAGGWFTTVPPGKPCLMAGEGHNLSSLASEWREGRKSGSSSPLMMLDLVLLPGPPGQRGEETKQNFIFRLQDPVVQEMAKLYNCADNSVKREYLTFFSYMNFRFYSKHVCHLKTVLTSTLSNSAPSRSTIASSSPEPPWCTE